MFNKPSLINFLIAFSLSAFSSIPAQTDSEKAEMLKKLNRSSEPRAFESTTSYSTPDIYDDSLFEKSIQVDYRHDSASFFEPDTALRRQSGAVEQISADTQKQEIPKPGPRELPLFGEGLFSAGAGDFSSAAIASAPPDYQLGPGDNLLVYLWGRVDLELNLTVDREGKVFIPRAGEIVAFGQTLEQFRERLYARLSSIYSEFELSVALGKIRTIRVYVYGEVNKPGAYTLSSLASLFNALYACGGPTENGSLRRVSLNRGGKAIATVDLYDFLLAGINTAALKLESEDVIFVPVVGPRAAVRGEVRRPAIYELKNQSRLLDVIELAGGVADEAYLGRVMIDRINGGEGRKLLDLSLESDSDRQVNNIEIHPGDDISVFAIYDRRENVVWVDGHVKHPGAYELEQGLTISELLAEGGQLKENVYLERADLIRTDSLSRQELIPVNLAEALKKNPAHDHLLQSDDSLRIYGCQEVSRQKYVSIAGEVRIPGEYKLFENMRLSDLIFMAGDLERGAYTLSAEIARRAPGKEIEILYVDLEAVKNGSAPERNIILQEDDYVFIRRMPKWELDNFVQITGEVRFPGKYALYRRDETLYELIQRAGGLTPEAFAFGTIFIRSQIAEKLEKMNLAGILDRSNPIYFDSAGNLSRTAIMEYNPGELSRLVIDMDRILKSDGQDGNIILQKGDQIYIPRLPSGIQITGAVASSGTIRYQPDKKATFYVDRAGGFLPHADKKNIRVIRANGQVVPYNKAKSYKMGLGDVVMVPSKIIREKSTGQTILTSVSIISSIATTIFILDRL